MPSPVLHVAHKVQGRAYSQLAALDEEWGLYLPLAHPLTLRVSARASRLSRGTATLGQANVKEGKLTRIHHPEAQDVADFVRSLEAFQALLPPPV